MNTFSAACSSIPLLEVRHLAKHFGTFKAVIDVSFAVHRGECVGLLGPNGAGKTTTLEMIEGIKTPSQGQILFHGEPMDDSYRQQIGIQFQHTALPDFLKVKDVLRLFSDLYAQGVSVQEVIEACSLTDVLERDHRKLSGGQRQRLLLGLALINDPALIFLDEPTTGLDPQARHHFWSLIQRLKQQGKTLLLTTHYMDEAAMLCDRLLIIEAGEVIAEGEPLTLLKKHFSGVVVNLPQMYESQLPTQFNWQANANSVSCVTKDVSGLLQALQQRNIELNTLTIRAPNLEDLFLKLTGRELRG